MITYAYAQVIASVLLYQINYKRMTVKITIEHKKHLILPTEYYPHLIQEWIKSILDNSIIGSTMTIRELYTKNKKQYPSFSFNKIQGNYKRNKEGLLKQSFSTTSHFIASFFVPQHQEEYVINLFNNIFFNKQIADYSIHFRVVNVERIKQPAVGDTMNFRLISPIVVRDKNSQQILPNHPDYSQVLLKQLARKSNAILSRIFHLPMDVSHGIFHHFDFLTKPKIFKHRSPHQQTIGHVFNFKIKAPQHLLHVGYKTGFGLSALAFTTGMVQIQ